MKSHSYNNVTISKIALQKNYLSMQEKAGQAHPLMAMIKADAYGHGAVEVARAVSEIGCKIFGVGEIREAVILRDAGIEGEIFIMLGFEPEQVSLFFEYRLTPVVFDAEAIRHLSIEGEKRGDSIGCHLKVDTGMSRLGVAVEEVENIANLIEELPAVKLEGLVSHFPEADIANSSSSHAAIEKFSRISEGLKRKHKLTCHLANSGGVLNFPEALFDMGRIGISLYGYHPAGRCDDECGSSQFLTPVMTCSTKVIQVKQIQADSGISYGHTYKTKDVETIAVLPIGYEDGFSRALSNKTEVLVRGKRAPVRGRICMNLCMVDVSHIEGVVVGDDVVLLGKQGDECITADELADKTGTISYEILCMFGHSNNKKYID